MGTSTFTTSHDGFSKRMKNKKATVKTLLDILAEIENIPTTATGSMDMKAFREMPEVQSVVTLIKFIKGQEMLNKFPVASILLAGMFREENDEESGTCILCGETYSHYGNNARPLADGRCCDSCNNDVILARMKGSEA